MSSPALQRTADNKIGFTGQGAGERVLHVVRRHPLVLSSRILAVVLLAWLPWFIFVFGSGFGVFFAVVFALTTIGGLGYLYVVWSDWFNTRYLVTNQRVIVMRQHNLWQRQVREVPLAKIQEVRHDQRGLLKVALHVGDVIVRIAAAELVLHDVTNPYDIEQKIGALIHRAHKPQQSAPVEY
jgi:hypothetical protein